MQEEFGKIVFSGLRGKRHLGLLLLCMVTFLFTFLTPIIHAELPTPVDGTWTYQYTSFVPTKQASGNTFVPVTESATWVGDFMGTSTMEISGMIHADGSINFKGVIYFDGSVLGEDGTLNISYNGRVSASGEVSCSWVIKSGTDELSALHGQGTYSGTGFTLDYSGNIHFDP